MKVAICISGQLRTYEKCYSNFLENILKPLNADVFMQIWDIVGSSHKEDSTKDDLVDRKKILAMYNPKSLVIESQPYKSSEELFGKKVPQELIDIEPVHYKSALSMFYQMKSCNDLAISYAMENNFEYDVIVRVRPDTMFLEKINPALLKKTCSKKNVVFFVDYAIDTKYQVCDKFAFGDSEGMINYSSLWDHIEEYWEDPVGNKPPKTHKVGERLMKYHTEVNDFNAIPFYMNLYTLRNNGEKLHYSGMDYMKKIKYIFKGLYS